MVRREIDDKLAQDLVIAVCGGSPRVCMVATHHTLFLLRSFQLLEVEPENRIKMTEIGEHPYFKTT